jgi:sec-independent protein translocase protein TatA
MSLLTLPVLGIFGVGPTELIIVLVILMLLFGGSKLPGLAKGLGQSIREFKKASKEGDDDGKAEKKPEDGNDASKLRNN